jgi:hypothetical protein
MESMGALELAVQAFVPLESRPQTDQRKGSAGDVERKTAMGGGAALDV